MSDFNNEKFDVTVSPICAKDGKKFAYVLFTDKKRSAEGRIPDCVITSNEGFTDDEISQLENYMKKELETLKNMASGIDVFRSFMR